MLELLFNRINESSDFFKLHSWVLQIENEHFVTLEMNHVFILIKNILVHNPNVDSWGFANAFNRTPDGEFLLKYVNEKIHQIFRKLEYDCSKYSDIECDYFGFTKLCKDIPGVQKSWQSDLSFHQDNSSDMFFIHLSLYILETEQPVLGQILNFAEECLKTENPYRQWHVVRYFYLPIKYSFIEHHISTYCQDFYYLKKMFEKKMF